jgi:hypothetical protein
MPHDDAPRTLEELPGAPRVARARELLPTGSRRLLRATAPSCRSDTIPIGELGPIYPAVIRASRVGSTVQGLSSVARARKGGSNGDWSGLEVFGGRHRQI